jgi:ABC-type Fe3+ transport system permease subunit
MIMKTETTVYTLTEAGSDLIPLAIIIIFLLLLAAIAWHKRWIRRKAHHIYMNPSQAARAERERIYGNPR